jgi:alkylation response protein AidB-like acyl-CoA dehydrogenase
MAQSSMVLSWAQDPITVYPGIHIAADVHQLINGALTNHLEEESEHDFPTGNIQTLAEEGFLGLMIPKEYGGLGLDPLNTTYAIEQIASVAPATAFVLLIHTLTANRINKAGSEAQKNCYLPRLAASELGASAWSEKGIGADKANMHTKAHLKDGVWHLNGMKAFCTNAGHASVYMVMSDTTEGKTFFLVDKDNPGLVIGEPMEAMGLQGTHSGQVGLDHATISDDDRVGEPGKIGPIIAYDVKAGLHGGIVATGIALGAFNRLLHISKSGLSFEKFESVRVRISSLAVQLSVMRTHCYALAQQASEPEGHRPAIDAATMTAKLFLSETALQMTTDAIAIAGTAGYLRENGLERLHRDALGIVIAAPINGQVLGSIAESLRVHDTESHLYKV